MSEITLSLSLSVTYSISIVLSAIFIPSVFSGRSLMCPTVDMTLKSDPKNFKIVLIFPGDSTMRSFFINFKIRVDNLITAA